MDAFLALSTLFKISIVVPIILLIVCIIYLIVLMNTNKKHRNACIEAEKNNEIWHFQQQQSVDKIEALQAEIAELKQQKVIDNQANDAKIDALQNTNTHNQRVLGEMHQKVSHLDQLVQDKADLQARLEMQLETIQKVSAENSALKSSIEKEREHMQEKLDVLDKAEKRLGTEFENIANKIFEQKSEKFTKTSESGLHQLLSPLKLQIDDFKKQITDQYVSEGKERAALKSEILGLKELNQKITEEAAALTNALKGDNKQQGNWGEIVLERVLEESGLRSGHEYEVQKSTVNQEGKRYQPDVVVHLPDNKDIVIDSKVSLVAYERYVNSEDKTVKEQSLKEHVNSIRGHIKGLSKKDYQDLEGLKTLDYVLMFVPVESAFIAAIEGDQSLVKLALDNQILLVSPTNLLVALRTIHNIWQYEYQNQNAAKIAEQARKMYDKFANFVGDMEKIGKNIELTNRSYDAAMNKLSTGRGNLINQAQAFKKLGVNTTKSIDAKYNTEDEALAHSDDTSHEDDAE
ncbi:DNA recombination protein RmuC [Agaribacter marinus]|uniref:DNA recombination protein RmuC n=1 Tax=Agaribacter marinus TaxID=1431249 RepID=A0AA37SUU3_9ALTE|nr:DNA recombination protein RmuC [Agaribacter marinus]GLR70281.1 DNA recombination protein RmuC [Agaribacter marinus]